MQTKTIQPIHVLYFETRTSFQEIFQYVRVEARKLYQDAVSNDLEITGPVYWVYQGADGRPDPRTDKPGPGTSEAQDFFEGTRG